MNSLTRVFTILFALAVSVFGQTALTSGVPAPFTLTGNFAVLENGSHGFVIAAPSDPFELTIGVVIAPSVAIVAVYARCGVDVGGANNNNPVYDTMAFTNLVGTANLFLAQPAGTASGKCFVALERNGTGGDPAATGGRMTVTIHPFPSGPQIAVSSLGSIYLAGQPAGTNFGNLSAPSNSPAQATISLTSGQGISVAASGQVNVTAPEGNNGMTSLVAAFGLSKIRAPANGLLGVFVGDSINSATTPMGFNFSSGDLVNTQTLYPMLQQVFYIGNGATSYGQTRVFVVPTGATRLFLASIAGGFSSSGSFVATVSAAAIPAPPPPANPLIVPSLADLFLLDQPIGTEVAAAGSGFAGAIVPLSSPLQVPIDLTAGQNVSIRGFLSISAGNGEGLDAKSGLSGLPELAGLAGVFVGNTVDPAATPATLSPNTSTVTLAPKLQQSFYIGNGLTTTGQQRNFTVPSGATRLFLAAPSGGFGASGVSPAVVTLDTANAPAISTGGIVNNGGFATGAVAAGSMVAIFGSNFGPLTGANALPLPSKLGGTQVFFDATPAPLFFVSPGQLVAQVPFEMYGSSQALVTVVNNGVFSLAQQVTLTSFAPGIFTTGAGDPVITDYNTGKLVSETASASRGDTLILWATGLGPTLLDPDTGSPAPNAASSTLLPMQVTLKNAASGTQVSAPVAYAGLAPGFIALDQINVQIPANTPTGTTILTLASPSLAAAKPVTIGIQ